MSSTQVNLLRDSVLEKKPQASTSNYLEESELCLDNGLGFLKRFNQKKNSKTDESIKKARLRMKKSKKTNSCNESILELSSVDSSELFKGDKISESSSVSTCFLNQKRNHQVIPKCSWDSKNDITIQISSLNNILYELFANYSTSDLLQKTNYINRRDFMTTQAQNEDIEQL